MIELKRTNSDNPAFQSLVAKLNLYLAEINGDKHDFYMQFNKIDRINYVVIAYEGNNDIGCGGMKEYDNETMEIKRMYISIEERKKGVATLILKELENWAIELGYKKCTLETGVFMSFANKLVFVVNIKYLFNP